MNMYILREFTTEFAWQILARLFAAICVQISQLLIDLAAIDKLSKDVEDDDDDDDVKKDADLEKRIKKNKKGILIGRALYRMKFKLRHLYHDCQKSPFA